jgi:hypothetical protein
VFAADCGLLLPFKVGATRCCYVKPINEFNDIVSGLDANEVTAWLGRWKLRGLPKFPGGKRFDDGCTDGAVDRAGEWLVLLKSGASSGRALQPLELQCLRLLQSCEQAGGTQRRNFLWWDNGPI